MSGDCSSSSQSKDAELIGSSEVETGLNESRNYQGNQFKIVCIVPVYFYNKIDCNYDFHLPVSVSEELPAKLKGCSVHNCMVVIKHSNVHFELKVFEKSCKKACESDLFRASFCSDSCSLIQLSDDGIFLKFCADSDAPNTAPGNNVYWYFKYSGVCCDIDEAIVYKSGNLRCMTMTNHVFTYNYIILSSQFLCCVGAVDAPGFDGGVDCSDLVYRRLVECLEMCKSCCRMALLVHSSAKDVMLLVENCSAAKLEAVTTTLSKETNSLQNGRSVSENVLLSCVGVCVEKCIGEVIPAPRLIQCCYCEKYAADASTVKANTLQKFKRTSLSEKSDYTPHPYVPKASNGDSLFLCPDCLCNWRRFRKEAAAAVMFAQAKGKHSMNKRYSIDSPSRGRASRKDWSIEAFASPTLALVGDTIKLQLDSKPAEALIPSEQLILPGETNEELCAVCSVTPRELLLCTSCPRSYCHSCVNRLHNAAEIQEIVKESNALMNANGELMKDEWRCSFCIWTGTCSNAVLEAFDGIVEDDKGSRSHSDAADFQNVSGQENLGSVGSKAQKESRQLPVKQASSPSTPLARKCKPCQSPIDNRGGKRRKSIASCSLGDELPPVNRGGKRRKANPNCSLGDELPPVNQEADADIYYFSQYVKAITPACRSEEASLNSPLVEDMGCTEDFCFLCKDGGDLMECDYCRESKRRGKKKRDQLKAASVNVTKGAIDDEIAECAFEHNPIINGHCKKVYHSYCLNYAVGDREKWKCPRHYCSVCGEYYWGIPVSAEQLPTALNSSKRVTVSMCQYCPNTVCDDCSEIAISKLVLPQKHAVASTQCPDIGSYVMMNKKGDSKLLRYQATICSQCVGLLENCVACGALPQNVVDGMYRKSPNGGDKVWLEVGVDADKVV